MINQLVLDENNVIVCWSIGGYLEGGINVLEIPDYISDSADPREWCYTEEQGYYKNPNYDTSILLASMKQDKIAESKNLLAEWLEKNPMQYTDGKYYSVTSEKQSLLNGNLASYERALNTGIEYPLKWNSTGEECVPWEYENLLALSLSIAAYVAPKVSIQQSIEVAINNCSTIEEINEIVINYDE